jgi:hypothetical protein
VVVGWAGSSRLGVGVAGLGGAEGEALGHVEPDFAVGQDVSPDQGRQAAEVFGGEDAGLFRFGDCHEHPRDTATASSRDLARQKTGPPRPMRLASGCARLAAIKRKRAIPTVGSGLHLLFTAINGTAAKLNHGKPTQEVDIV